MDFVGKRRFGVVLALLAAGLFVVLGAFGVFAGSAAAKVQLHLPAGFSSPKNVELISAGENGFLLCGTQNSTTFVQLLDENGQLLGQAQAPVSTAYSLYRGNRLSLVSPYLDDDGFGVQVHSYQVRQNQLVEGASFELPQVYVTARNDFDMDDSGRYYAAHTPMPELLIFTPSGSYLNAIPPAQGSVQSLAISPDQVLYSLYSGEGKLGIQPLPDSITEQTHLQKSPLYESDVPTGAFRFLSADTLIDSKGDLYAVQPETRLLLKTAQTGGDFACAARMPDGRVLVKTDTDFADAFEDGGQTVGYAFPGELISLAAGEEKTAAVVREGDDWFFLPVTEELCGEGNGSSEPEGSGQEEESSETESQPSESSDSGESPSVKIVSLSNAVRADRDKQCLYLPSGTTWSSLKNLVQAEGARLEAQKPNGVPLVSGYVMTGAVLLAKDESGAVADALTVVVPGDLSGSGSVTQSSVKLFYRVLSGTAELDEASFAAADLDGDGQLTTADLLRLKKELKKSP